MTEQFGICGQGWKYTIDKLWTEQGTAGQVFCFALISVYVRGQGDTWNDPIPGIGGHMLIEHETKGLHNNDEGYKMAVTDALSVALKMLGVAADIYLGLWDGSKYRDNRAETTLEPQTEGKQVKSLTVAALMDKMSTSVNIHELNARTKKYRPDFDKLTGPEQKQVKAAKEQRKAELETPKEVSLCDSCLGYGTCEKEPVSAGTTCYEYTPAEKTTKGEF